MRLNWSLFLSRIRQHPRSILLLTLSIMLSVVFTVDSQVPTVRVVVNSSVVPQKMSVEQIRRIFSMRQTAWSDGKLITVYVLINQHETHQTFSTKVLGMFPYQLDRIWNKLVYSGLGEEPIKVRNEQEMLELVSQHPGAIGYVMGQVDSDKVNVINVVKDK